MSLLIYTAHLGGVLQADGNTFASLEELRRWIEHRARLPSSCQILMTARGTNVRASGLSNEREIFLYDRKMLELTTKPLVEPLPKPPNITPFPDDLESETDMASWRMLFKKRKIWAEQIFAQAEALALRIREVDAATGIMQRAVIVAFTNLETHSLGLEESLVNLRKWAGDLMDDREKILASWESAVRQIARIPVHDELRKYGGADERGSRKVAVLLDFVDIKDVQAAAVTAGTLERKLEDDVRELGHNIEDVCAKTGNLKASIQAIATRAAGLNVEEELAGLLEEINLLVNKVRSDYEYARGLQGPKSASAASKRAYASTTDYLPGLTGVMEDMGKLLMAACDQKNSVGAICHDHLLNIAVIQSLSAPINPHINKLDAAYQEEDAHFQLLSLVIQLPTTYGSLLVECVRRREWSEKFQGNSQKLAEELALMKEEEEKRRRKWQRSTGGLLPFDIGESQILRAELNTRGDASGGLPKVTRQDVETYIAALKNAGVDDAVVKDLAQALQEIDRPSRRINKRLKGFKMGSIHEAAMTSSFISTNGAGRNDEEVKALRMAKEQLNERIKGYESRIRKLEDLVHRARAANGNPYPANTLSPPVGTPQSSYPQPPHSPEQNFAKLVSQPQRRALSEPQGSVEAYKTRITELVAELAAEKERADRLEKAASENTESERAMNAQILQADETKRDLVANLEATVQGHIAERKELTAEIDELKEKLEAAYEELDRIEDEKVKSLEHELEVVGGELSRLQEDFEREAEVNKGLNWKLGEIERGKEAEIAQLKAELERQTARAEAEKKRAEEAEAGLAAAEEAAKRFAEDIVRLEKDLEARNGQNDSLLGSVRRFHGHLSADKAPEATDALVGEVDRLVVQAVQNNKDLKLKLDAEIANSAEFKRQKEFLQNRFDTRTLRAKDLTQRLYTHNARSIQLLESLGYKVVRGEDSMQIIKVPRQHSSESTVLTKSVIAPPPAADTPSPKSTSLALVNPSAAEDFNLLYWMDPDSDTESEKYTQYLKTIVAFDLDAFSETIITRVKKAEQDARQLMKQGRAYREKYYRARDEASEKIAFKNFKIGDLALFLPTRNQVARPWAAFNVGAPHFFLREHDTHKLAARDWLLARISKVEERVVDLSRPSTALTLSPLSTAAAAAAADAASIDDENPFELSDGLRWYLLDAVEEKAGAPSTPGLSTSTVAAANVDAKGSIRTRKAAAGAKKKLGEITAEHGRRGSGGSGGRASMDVAVGGLVMGDEVAVVDVAMAAPPRTPVEKIVASVRSRAGSLRSIASVPEGK